MNLILKILQNQNDILIVLLSGCFISFTSFSSLKSCPFEISATFLYNRIVNVLYSISLVLFKSSLLPVMFAIAVLISSLLN